jgi:hypothetical protein
MRFIKSIKNFRQELLLLENKDQALSILRKKGLDEGNPNYQYLKDIIQNEFNNLNYLGLMCKYHFIQDVSLQEIKDLLPWLKENGGTLSKNPLSYKKFEDLKDEIIQIDNKQRVNTILRLMNKEQRELFSLKDKKFFEHALEIHKLGMNKDFVRKLFRYKTRDEIIGYMSEFIKEKSSDISYQIIIDKLKKLNTEVVYTDIDNGIIVAEILDFYSSNKIGSLDWCIVTSKSNWDYYTRGTRRQFFMWDFSLDRTESYFMIGFTTNDIGNITNIHDKFDENLKDSVPKKVTDILVKMDFSIDLFKYKLELIKKIDSDESLKRIGDLRNNDLIVVKVGDYGGFNKIKQHKWDYYDPTSIYSNTYVVFNFDKNVESFDFAYVVNSSEYEDGKKILDITDNSGKLSNELTGYLTEIEDLFIPKKTDEAFDQLKNEYLNKVEPIFKGSNIINNWRGKVEPINTSKDKGSTGKFWLFKLDNNDLFTNFTSERISTFDEREYDKIKKYNLYVLVDIERSFGDANFVRFIKTQHNDTEIKYHNKNDKLSKYTNDELPDDIKKLAEEKYIVIKTESDYREEIRKSQQEIFNKAERDYYDDRTDLYGKILFDFLIDSDVLNKEDYLEYDEENDEYVGEVPEDAHHRILIPDGSHYGNLLSFSIYTQKMAISGYSTDQVWAIGNDDECDKAAYDSQESLLDDIGYEGFREGYLDYYIDGEKMAEHLTEGEEDYYREDITENPSYYDLEKKMSEKDQIELEKREEELEKLSDRQTKIEENYEKYRKWYKKKSNEFFQLAKNAETEEEEEMFDKKIEELEKRFEKNEERFENLIGAITEKIDEVQEIIDELEDEDNWYYDEDEIEEKVEEYVNSKKEEIINDPMQYLKDMGYDGKAMREMIENYIDKDKLIKDMIRDDGRGNSLAGYDGTENEYLYTDEDGEQTYYIYRIN